MTDQVQPVTDDKPSVLPHDYLTNTQTLCSSFSSESSDFVIAACPPLPRLTPATVFSIICKVFLNVSRFWRLFNAFFFYLKANLFRLFFVPVRVVALFQVAPTPLALLKAIKHLRSCDSGESAVNKQRARLSPDVCVRVCVLCRCAIAAAAAALAGVRVLPAADGLVPMSCKAISLRLYIPSAPANS